MAGEAKTTTTKYKPAQWRVYCPNCTKHSAKDPQFDPRCTVTTKKSGQKLICPSCHEPYTTA